ncbi:MAG: glycosyltransferase [Acidobacteriaceae bacterium]
MAGQFDEIHFIDVAGRADRRILESHGIRYHGPEPGDGKIIKSRELLTLLRQLEPEAIICHYASGDHFFSAIAYGRCPVGTIAMGHDVLYEEGDSFVPAFTKLLTRMGLRQSHYVVAKSTFLAKRIRSYGVRSPVEVNYWGANLTRYRPGEQIEARRALRLAESGVIILSPRAIEPRLNIHLIVEAFHALAAKYHDASLVILGRSSQNYKNRIKETIARLNLADKTYVLDEIPEEILSQYYQASDVVVSMASSEGFPNTLLEVMACKVPMVVGQIAQIEELLEDDRNAWICDLSAPAIAAAIEDILRDGEKRRRIVSAAYETVKRYGDIRKNGVLFSDRLKQIAEEWKPGFRPMTFIFRMLYGVFRIQRRLISRKG